MTTSVAAAGNTALASLQDLAAGLQNVQNSLPKTGMDPILRMQKDGIWVYGQENTQVEGEQVWAVNPYAIQHGYIAWLKRPEGSKEPAKVLGEVMVPMTHPKPVQSTLAPLTEPGSWTDQVALMLRGVGGEDDGIQIQYKTNSVGGTRAVTALITAILDQVRTDPSRPVPLVVLGHSTYQHKAHGKIYNPELTIVGWTDMDGTDLDATAPAEVTDEIPFDPQPAPEPVVQAAPAARTRATVPPVQQAAPAAAAAAPGAAPVRRRR